MDGEEGRGKGSGRVWGSWNDCLSISVMFCVRTYKHYAARKEREGLSQVPTADAVDFPCLARWMCACEKRLGWF